MSEGVITGGWEYVWAAYGITWAGLVFYGTRLVLAVRQGAREASDDANSGGPR